MTRPSLTFAVEPDKEITSVSLRRTMALTLSVVHYGLACLAEGAIPSKPETVIQTARRFEDYIATGNGAPVERRRR